MKVTEIDKAAKPIPRCLKDLYAELKKAVMEKKCYLMCLNVNGTNHGVIIRYTGRARKRHGQPEVEAEALAVLVDPLDNVEGFNC